MNLNIRVFNLDMKELLNKNISFEIGYDEKKVVLKLPDFIEGLDPTYFLDLRIFSNLDENLTINQYLLTHTKHEFDWDKTYFVHTPTKKHQNLRQINDLPDVQLVSDLIFTTSNNKMNLTIEVENPTDQLALSVELMILDVESGHFIAPVYLDDNYFSLLPGEKRKIEGYCYIDDLDNKSLKLKVSGLNLK